MAKRKRAPAAAARLATVPHVSRAPRPRRRPTSRRPSASSREAIARAYVVASVTMLDAEPFRLVASKLEGYARRMKRHYPGRGLELVEDKCVEYFDWFRRTNGR